MDRFRPIGGTRVSRQYAAYWSIIIVNNTGVALNATQSDHTKEYLATYITVA